MNFWPTEPAREFFRYVFYVAVISSFSWFGPLVGGADAAVLISEICGDPASDWNADGAVSSRGDEWIEVINTGPASVDLADYWLRDALGDDPQFRFDGVLAAGQTALFFGSDAEAWQAAEGLSVSGLSLNNAGDVLELFLGRPGEPGTQLVDVLAYDGHTADDDRSLARFLPEDEWVLCDGLNPYGGGLEPTGSGCAPTPGATNFCPGLVPAERSTWSELKSDWR